MQIKYTDMGMAEMQYTMAVRAVVKAPCHGLVPLTRLADFFAAARYCKVGIVVAIMMGIGATVTRKERIFFVFLIELAVIMAVQE